MNELERQAAINFHLRQAQQDMPGLTEEQQYYEYASRPFRFKTPPVLNRELQEAMQREGLDNDYRFIWGGVVLVRDEPNSPKYQIARGSIDACEPINGTMMPKHIFQRVTQARGLFYRNGLGQKVCVARAELAPPDKAVEIEYKFVDLGILRWYVETRLNGQQLVESGYYRDDEPVPADEWVCIGQIHSQGRYYAPGLEWIDLLKKRVWENENRPLKDVAREMMKKFKRARANREKQEAIEAKKEFDQLFDDVVRRNVAPHQVDLGHNAS